jgi:hypothetical protein
MHKQVFKESQLFSWDTEPVDERPSEFMHSTGYASLSGYHSGIEAPRRAARRSRRFGLASVLVFALIVVAAGGWAIAQIAPMLRH